MTEKEEELCDLLLSLPCETEEEIPNEHTYARIIIAIYAKDNGLTEEFIEKIKGLNNPTLEEVDKLLLGDLPPLEIDYEDDDYDEE